MTYDYTEIFNGKSRFISIWKMMKLHILYLIIFHIIFDILYLFLYSAQYLHVLQDSKRYLTHPTAQVQSQLTSNSHSPN